MLLLQHRPAFSVIKFHDLSLEHSLLSYRWAVVREIWVPTHKVINIKSDYACEFLVKKESASKMEKLGQAKH